MSANNRDLHRPNAAESDARRRRRWAPKVRTGCLTCKIRRVKCDEKRPSCEKCLSTGRKCDGYEDEQINQSPPDHAITKTTRGRRGRPSKAAAIERRQQQQHHQSGSSAAALMPSKTPYSVSWLPFYGGELEKKHFDFFQSVTSSSLAGFYGSEFWARETLQVAHQYPALFHAITAFGSIHHGYLSDTTPSDIPRMGTNDKFIEFGLQEFNKAIKSMYKLIAQEQISFRDQQAILTTCILFTCLSSLQGRQFQSFMHVRNGMKLIQTWRLNNDQMYRENKKVIDTLVLTFLGLDTQIRPYIGGQESLLQWTDEDIAAPFIDERPFESLFDAFFDLEVIINRIFRLSFANYTSDECYLDIELLIHQVEVWDDRFSLLLLTVPLSSIELDSLDFVRLRREFIRVVLVPLTSQGTKNSHDEVSEIYLEIIDLVEKVLQRESRIASPEWSAYQKPKNPIFVLGSTVIEVLYVVATRSREPTIRRRALQLIKLHPRREGICETMAASKMVQLLIDIEEQGCPRSVRYANSCPASSSPFCSTEEESTSSDTFSLPFRTMPPVSSASRLSSFHSPYNDNNDTTSQSASEAVKETLSYQKATIAPGSNVTTTIATGTPAKLPCSEKGQWVCETHRVVDIQYLLLTERQLKTVIWTMEDRLMGKKGRALVVSWW